MAAELQREQLRTYRAKLGSRRATSIAGEVSWGSGPPAPKLRRRCGQSLGVESQRSQGLFKPQVFRGRGGERGAEEAREELGGGGGEGEEGVVGRLRCEVSTFPARETAKQPPAGLPTSPALQAQRMAPLGPAGQEAGPRSPVTRPSRTRRQCPSCPRAGLRFVPHSQGEQQVSIWGRWVWLGTEIPRSSLKRRSLPAGGRRWAWPTALPLLCAPRAPGLHSGHWGGGAQTVPTGSK